jgi:hypothetical protein
MKFTAIFIFGLWTGFLFGQNISQYTLVLLKAEAKQKSDSSGLAIRSLVQDNVPMFLLVYPRSLKTQVVKASNYRTIPVDWNNLRQEWKDTPYLKALAIAGQNDSPLQDAGIKRSSDKETGISLTADLCPSQKTLDRRIFTAMIQSVKPNALPLPIALSVSGLWMQNHNEDLNWLKSLQAKRKININWINHTLNHPWDKTLPLSINFLLEKGTELSNEVLGNEALMLKNGLTPSCFFRFPGLVSDKAIVDQIIEWGLIPVGSDAWLAKGQQPQASGSIVLIHANGNEPIGVEDFLRLMQQKKTALQRGTWRLVDLSTAIIKE